MEISERCKKRLDDLDNMINKMKIQGRTEPYNVVVWDIDVESIIELDLSYQDTIAENHDLKKQIENVKRQTYDMYSHKLEAENNSLRNTIKNMKENFTEHLNALEAENHNLKHDIEELKCCNGNQSRTIGMLREANDSQFNQIKAYKDKLFTKDEEIRKLYEKVDELHTIKKSFEVLRALYLGDYENDEPF